MLVTAKRIYGKRKLSNEVSPPSPSWQGGSHHAYDVNGPCSRLLAGPSFFSPCLLELLKLKVYMSIQMYIYIVAVLRDGHAPVPGAKLIIIIIIICLKGPCYEAQKWHFIAQLNQAGGPNQTQWVLTHTHTGLKKYFRYIWPPAGKTGGTAFMNRGVLKSTKFEFELL